MKKTTKKSTKTVSTPKKKTLGVTPLGDRVLIRPLSPEEMGGKTIGGIIIPDTLDKEKPEQGTVLALGEGRLVNGKRIPINLKVGDKVIFSKYAYDEIKVDGEEYYMLKEDNVLAVLK